MSDDGRIKVLLVDDNVGARDLLEEILNDAGFFTGHASHGRAALEIMEEEHYQAIISDEVMPQMSGTAMFTKLRESGNKIPFILLTGLRAGEVTFDTRLKPLPIIIEKPFKLDRFIEILSDLIERGAIRSA